MEKFIVYFSNGEEMSVWSTDKKHAKFHLQPYATKKKISIIKVERYKSVA